MGSMYDPDWTRRLQQQGIVPCSKSVYYFTCVLCDNKDIKISTGGLDNVLRHIRSNRHTKAHDRVVAELKEKMVLLLDEEAADGMGREELMRRSATVAKANPKIQEWALCQLAEEEAVVAHKDETGEIVWLEKAQEPPDTPDSQTSPPEAANGTGITTDQLRPAFVFLVKEKKRSCRKVAKFFGVSRDAVAAAVKRFEETGGFANRPGQGRPRTATDPVHVEEAMRHIVLNPKTTKMGGRIGRSVRNLARLMRGKRESTRRILKNELGLKPYKDGKRKKLTALHRIQRFLRARELRARFSNNRHRRILFTDESPFVIEQHHNAQNSRTWSFGPPDPDERTVEREQKPAGVMVWGGVGYGIKTELIFVPEGLKVNTPVYLRLMEMVEADLKQKIGYTEEKGWARMWTFQQDGAPSHTSHRTQRWLLEHFPDVITKNQWPANSPDLNPIELIWGILKPRVNAVAHPTVESLEAALLKEWRLLSQDEIDRTIDNWVGRLKKVVDAKGGRFEY